MLFRKLREKIEKRRAKKGKCVYCGRKLTEEEQQYYVDSCERCETRILKEWERF